MKKLNKLFPVLFFLIIFVGCNREYVEPVENVKIENGPLVYPGTTHFFDETESGQLVTGYSEATGEVVMEKNKNTSVVEEGHILMLGPSDKAPFGALRKVTNVKDEGGNYRFETVQGALNEAIEEGEVTVNLQLSPENIYSQSGLKGAKLKSATESNVNVLDISLDDVDLTNGSDYPIILNGEITLDIQPEVEFRFRLFNPPDIITTVTADMVQNVNINASHDFELGDEVTVYEAYFSPIVLYGIVLVPKLEIFAGYDGEFHTSVSASSNQHIENSYIVAYQNEDLTFEKSKEVKERMGSVSVTGSGEMGVYTGPELDVLVFGVVGPYVNLKADLRLSADIDDCPWWNLKGKLGGEMGINGNIFGIDELMDPYTIDFAEWTIMEADDCYVVPGYVNGKVIDAVSREPVQNVKVSIGTGTPQNFNSLISTYSDINGNFELTVSPGSNYIIKFEKAGYYTNTYQISGEIMAGEILYLEKELQINETYVGSGSVGGIITNAFTGYPIENVKVELLEGKNSTSNQPAEVTYTNTDGEYLFSDVSTGHYTIKLSKDGFVANSKNVIAIGGEDIRDQNATLSPEMSSSEWRIVLTWGSSPSDLDSHVTGPISGTDRFHVFYSDKNYSNGDFNANLDVDDVTSYGPETITLTNISDGLYRYSVHDYSNRGDSNSIAMSNSGAKVVVYNGGQLIGEFNVPNQEGTLWTVFEIENQSLRIKNVMEYESNPGEVKSASKTDATLILDLPEKNK